MIIYRACYISKIKGGGYKKVIKREEVWGREEVLKMNNKTNPKIMAIIYSDKRNFLILRTNPKWLKVDIWFVVTGSVEKNESEEKAIRREVKEETGLEILEIKKTDYLGEYEWPKNSGKMHKERAFLIKVKEAIPKLSGEHTEFRWLSKEKFIEQIDWDESIDSKEKLVSILGDVSLSNRGDIEDE